jgi:hypothetical protein
MPRVDECVVDVREMDQRHCDGQMGYELLCTPCIAVTTLATGSHALLRKASTAVLRQINVASS